MAKYVFPAIFTQDAEGYSVDFPDVHNCFTSGVDLEEALDMAQDVLCLMLYRIEEKGEMLPKPSNLKAIPTEDNQFISLVACDTLEYRKMYESRAVKKTLSIPAWLNTMAEREGINFSATLQEALKHELHI